MALEYISKNNILFDRFNEMYYIVGQTHYDQYMGYYEIAHERDYKAYLEGITFTKNKVDKDTLRCRTKQFRLPTKMKKVLYL